MWVRKSVGRRLVVRLSTECLTVRKYVSTVALDTRPSPNSKSTADCLPPSLAYLNEKHRSPFPHLQHDVPVKEISQDTRPKWKIREPLVKQLNDLW